MIKKDRAPLPKVAFLAFAWSFDETWLDFCPNLAYNVVSRDKMTPGSRPIKAESPKNPSKLLWQMLYIIYSTYFP